TAHKHTHTHSSYSELTECCFLCIAELIPASCHLSCPLLTAVEGHSAVQRDSYTVCKAIHLYTHTHTHTHTQTHTHTHQHTQQHTTTHTKYTHYTHTHTHTQTQRQRHRYNVLQQKRSRFFTLFTFFHCQIFLSHVNICKYQEVFCIIFSKFLPNYWLYIYI